MEFAEFNFVLKLNYVEPKVFEQISIFNSVMKIRY